MRTTQKTNKISKKQKQIPSGDQPTSEFFSILFYFFQLDKTPKCDVILCVHIQNL